MGVSNMNYVFTDVHGNKKLFNAIVKFLEETDSHAFCLGDACDRGQNGYSIMKYMLTHPERFTYLKGNHEELFTEAACAIIAEAKDANQSPLEFFSSEIGSLGQIASASDEILDHIWNGGLPTLQAWIEDGCPTDILSKLDALPKSLSFQQYDLCHAGCEVSEWDLEETDYLWNRSHFQEPWREGRILIHGHTPVDKLSKENGFQPYFYQNGTKIDLDVRTARSNIIYLYCLEDKTTKLIKEF